MVPVNRARLDETFPHSWTAEILQTRPLILPPRHYTYPAEVEEVERGALELLVQPGPAAMPFLATCALGFASPAVPSGVWSCPNPDSLCAVAGGYAYILNARRPEQWTQVEYRPVTEIRPVPELNLLLFASFHTVVAWGREGQNWQTRRLSWEGVRLIEVRGGKLHGWGWEMQTDQEIEFAIDLRTGEHTGGPAF